VTGSGRDVDLMVDRHDVAGRAQALLRPSGDGGHHRHRRDRWRGGAQSSRCHPAVQTVDAESQAHHCHGGRQDCARGTDDGPCGCCSILKGCACACEGEGAGGRWCCDSASSWRHGDDDEGVTRGKACRWMRQAKYLDSILSCMYIRLQKSHQPLGNIYRSLRGCPEVRLYVQAEIGLLQLMHDSLISRL
jgi:hypothetical protein